MLACLMAAAQAPVVMKFSATTENVSGGQNPIRIELFRWSTDAERDQLVAAWNMTNTSAAPAAGRGGRAGGGRGGRGGGGADTPRATPESSLAAALATSPTVGYLWSSEVAGYAVRYAARFPSSDGGEHIILLTDRRLGAGDDQWKPTSPGPGMSYEFSLIELHLNPNGQGEGKASLMGKVMLDPTTKALALDNYEAVPALFKGVKRSNK
jgi:hypothetical protein